MATTRTASHLMGDDPVPVSDVAAIYRYLCERARCYTLAVAFLLGGVARDTGAAVPIRPSHKAMPGEMKCEE